MSGIGHALVNLFTVSTVLYWDQRENTAQLKQIQHPASFEVCSQVYNMEIKVHFSLDLFTRSTINVQYSSQVTSRVYTCE